MTENEKLITEAQQKSELAKAKLTALCEGKETFTMRIPADRTYDHDLIFMDAFNALDDTLSALRSALDRAEQAEHWLSELLAVIHRDGGHYTAEHGMQKSVNDALVIAAHVKADHATLAAVIAQEVSAKEQAERERDEARAILAAAQPKGEKP